MIQDESTTQEKPKVRVIPDGDRVYHEIKARVISCEFEQGKPIRMCQLAQQLGVGKKPVREALGRLAAEGLIINEPNKGFIAMRLTQERLIELYGWNQFLLKKSLSGCRARAELPDEVAVEISDIGHELGQGHDVSKEEIAAYAGYLFCGIAELAQSSHIAESVNNVNESLHYVRTHECELLSNTDLSMELADICELLLKGDYTKARRMIAKYHEARLALLDDLVEELESSTT